jgi:(p)ppGpp synthase/HD superfamily hydrolase
VTEVRTFAGWDSFAHARTALDQQFPTTDVDWLGDIYAFAVDRHGDQTRPAGEPYARHLLEVVDVLVNGVETTDLALLAAGILHDTVEDTDTTSTELIQRFGTETADLVGWVTQPVESGSRSAYLARLEAAPPRALTLKLADRLSNVQRLDAHPRPAKQRSYYRETVAHIVPLSTGHPFFEPWYQSWRQTFAHLAEPPAETIE